MDTQHMQAQFNRVAVEYDSGRRKFIPCFDDFYAKSTAFIAGIVKSPARILDLGAGTGMLTMYYFRHFPQAEYLLDDVAAAMLTVAQKRFAGMANMAYESADYTRKLPEGAFDMIISALSIHHVENAAKPALFRAIYDKLPAGGVLVNHDQFCADTPEISARWDRYWIDWLEHSGLSAADLSMWRERRKLDRECSLNMEISMLKQCGFASVDCVYSNQKFSVVTAVKA